MYSLQYQHTACDSQRINERYHAKLEVYVKSKPFKCLYSHNIECRLRPVMRTGIDYSLSKNNLQIAVMHAI